MIRETRGSLVRRVILVRRGRRVSKARLVRLVLKVTLALLARRGLRVMLALLARRVRKALRVKPVILALGVIQGRGVILARRVKMGPRYPMRKWSIPTLTCLRVWVVVIRVRAMLSRPTDAFTCGMGRNSRRMVKPPSSAVLRGSKVPLVRLALLALPAQGLQTRGKTTL